METYFQYGNWNSVPKNPEYVKIKTQSCHAHKNQSLIIHKYPFLHHECISSGQISIFMTKTNKTNSGRIFCIFIGRGYKKVWHWKTYLWIKSMPLVCVGILFINYLKSSIHRNSTICFFDSLWFSSFWVMSRHFSNRVK